MKFCNSVIDENSKYFKIYKSLIDKCRNRSSIKFYTERHHVIPKSLGGSNDETNLVNLTYREHYIAHLLLTKFILDEDSKVGRSVVLSYRKYYLLHKRPISKWKLRGCPGWFR